MKAADGVQIAERYVGWYKALMRERVSDIKQRVTGEDVVPLIEELSRAEERERVLRDALVASRDVLVAFQKQAGWNPAQKAYSTKVTEGEMQLSQAVADIDAILTDAALTAAPEQPASKACPQCDGTGELDSGGVQPWGEGIFIGCPLCKGTGKHATAAPEQGKEAKS